jgi:hypothetical protein
MPCTKPGWSAAEQTFSAGWSTEFVYHTYPNGTGATIEVISVDQNTRSMACAMSFWVNFTVWLFFSLTFSIRNDIEFEDRATAAAKRTEDRWAKW